MSDRNVARRGPQVLAVGVDIGRTKIATGVVSDDGRIIDRVVVPAPSHLAYEGVVGKVVASVKDMVARHPDITCVGVGTAEVVDWPSGDIRLVTGDDALFPLRGQLEKSTGLPTVVDSDANVAAWAEFRFGAATKTKNAALVSVGTGVGAGLIVDGEIYRGHGGFAGELGHIVVHPFGENCSCGNVGCLEAMASGTALARNARRAAARDPDGTLARLAGGADQITGETVFEAAAAGDAHAVALFNELGGWLGLGVAATVLLFDPEIVVIGGGLARTGDLLLQPTTRSARRNSLVLRGHMPPIVPASHDTWSGLLGAAILALDLQAKPSLGAASDA